MECDKGLGAIRGLFLFLNRHKAALEHGMRSLFRLLFILAAWLGSASLAAAAAKPDLVILISIDGFRADYLGHHQTPVIEALAKQGAVGPMRPSFPSLTFPNHYTLVTGLWPDHHGIVDNTMDDPVLGHFTEANSVDTRWWSGAEPLWVTADKQGLKTATMFWPGSDRLVQGLRPDYWKLYDKSFLADARVDQVLQWLDLPQDQRPSFVTLYFDLVDTVGHHNGPGSKELDAALASTEVQIGRLMNGLKARGLYDHTNLIVTADHGMADTSKDRVVYIDDAAGGTKAIHTVTLGTTSGLSIAADAPPDTLAKLLAPHEHMQCWQKADIPKALHYGTNPRVPPIVCAAEVGWYITTHARLATTRDFPIGSHGYDPAAPEMAALFVAEGPAFKPGQTLPAFDNVDVQPLIARLLHLDAPKGDGDAKVFDRVLRAP
jgi:predicted AlkP superfamily pyrophosphatase or phosphodiesterase